SANAGGVLTFAITQNACGVWLVEGCPMPYPIAKPSHGNRGIFGEPGSDIPVLPSAEVLEGLRQIPVIKADPRLDVFCQHGLAPLVIECEPLWVWSAAALRQNARPGGRQPVGAYAELAHQRDIFGPPMIVVAGNVARIAAEGITRLMAEAVPDRGPATILPDGTLDLVSRGRDAPANRVG